MATNTTTTEPTKADKLAERYKRTIDRANDREAKAEADRIAAEKLAAAIEAEQAKKAEREAAEAAEQAEAERQAKATDEATGELAEIVAAETRGLVGAVKHAWKLGEVVISAGLKARPVAIAAMGDEAWADLKAKHAKAKGEGKVKGQAQPRNLSKVNDSVNIRKRFATEAEAVQAARDWVGDDPKSVSLRSFAKGESVNKPTGAPMSARDAARLFAKAVARDGLTDEQAMDLIAEAMANVAE